MTARKHRSAGSVRAVFARFFIVLYALASLVAVLHQDHRNGPNTNVPPGLSIGRHAPGTTGSRHPASNPDTIAGSDRFCAICDFVSHMVSSASAPQVASQLHAVLVGVGTPPIRPQPYTPFRFFARLASRAPPAV